MRPIVVCATARDALEDLWGNKGSVISLAADRLLTQPCDARTTRKMLVAIRRMGKEIADGRTMLRSCDQCHECNGKPGIILDLEV